MRFTYIIILGLISFLIFSFYVFLTPVKITNSIDVEIPKGSSIQTASEILKTSNVIKSKDVYTITTRIIASKGVIAGNYSFSGNVYLHNVILKTTQGNFGIKQIKITIPEGFTAQEVVNRIEKNFPEIPKSDIENTFLKKEGYIYPETYFFSTKASLTEIENKIMQTGIQKITAIIDPIDIQSNQAKRIINIASLVEAEGKNKQERQMIAGVIENRLNKNMPLQLDATLTYLTGKGSSQLTLNDLKIDSPYNTYVYKGLPPGPINNPGEESILAAMNPTKNDYIYYLHDKNGNIYYAKTFNEHVQNKNKYLK